MKENAVRLAETKREIAALWETKIPAVFAKCDQAIDQNDMSMAAGKALERVEPINVAEFDSWQLIELTEKVFIVIKFSIFDKLNKIKTLIEISKNDSEGNITTNRRCKFGVHRLNGPNGDGLACWSTTTRKRQESQAKWGINERKDR